MPFGRKIITVTIIKKKRSHHEAAVRLPSWCFCIKELVKLHLVVADKVLLQFVNTVRVLGLEN